ncbi:MAG: GUN4 domain-containing protein [Synechocystis sp.]|nr:GUN4 domain-containing protein [Synechocystis sp.]
MITATDLLKLTTTLFLGSLLAVPGQFVQAQPAPPIPKTTTTNDVNGLVSPQTQLDYAPLQGALAAGEFEAANEITRRLLLAAAQRSQQGWLTVDSINQVACWDLKTMDDLWRQYSNNRFGFSVQYAIFQETGNRPGRLMSPENYDKFGDRLGWRKDGQWIIFKKNLDFSASAPVGHLPSPRDEYQINGGRLEYTALMGRMQACQTGQTSKTSPDSLQFTPFRLGN